MVSRILPGGCQWDGSWLSFVGLADFLFTQDLLPVSVYDTHSVGPSIQPIFTRWCFKMTNMIQACSESRRARVIILNTLLDEMVTYRGTSPIRKRPTPCAPPETLSTGLQ